jgi:hypothetical protein
MTDEEKEIYEKQVREANDVKAVRNSKGWKETIQPMIMMVRDAIMLKGRRGESSEILVDGQGRQTILTKYNPSDPYSAAKALWMVEGIDAVLAEFKSIIDVGEAAKQILKQSDTIVKS